MKTSNKPVKVYNLVSKKPLVKFYYQGSHSHPVRRVVLVIEETKEMIVGYEMRQGKVVRSIYDSLKIVKSYRKDKIAKWGDYHRLRMSSKNRNKKPNRTTLERFSVLRMLSEGY